MSTFMPLEKTNTSIPKCERTVRNGMAKKSAPENELSLYKRVRTRIFGPSGTWVPDTHAYLSNRRTETEDHPSLLYRPDGPYCC